MSIFSATKALVDATAVTMTYRSGEVPDDAVFPYASILDPVGDAPALEGDARTLAFRRLLQVDLWQTIEGEDVTLLEDLIDVLDGAPLADGFRLRVSDANVIPEENEIVHHAITVSAVRLR